MKPESMVSKIIDLSAEYDLITDFEIDLKDGVVLDARLELNKGFISVFRNFDTGKVAFAWIVAEERVFGADNTGGWHIHPFNNPQKHKGIDQELVLEEFIEEVSENLVEA